MLEKHLPMIHDAGKKGVQILCLQEIFNGPYFCPGQDKRWYDAAEPVPGPTVEKLAPIAAKYQMAMVVPLYEREQAGVYYNTAAILDADGSYLGKYRKTHIPQTSGFWEKYFFRPGNLGYPVFKTRYATIGVYICYDRHFPEGARALGLAGAEIVYNPSATVAGLSQYLWKLEQPAHAVANGYFVGAINRVGTEAPWNIGKFYGNSYFVDPRGQILACGSRGQGRAGRRGARPRPDRGSPPHLAVLPRPPPRRLRPPRGGLMMTRDVKSIGHAAGGLVAQTLLTLADGEHTPNYIGIGRATAGDKLKLVMFDGGLDAAKAWIMPEGQD